MDQHPVLLLPPDSAPVLNPDINHHCAYFPRPHPAILFLVLAWDTLYNFVAINCCNFHLFSWIWNQPHATFAWLSFTERFHCHRPALIGRFPATAQQLGLLLVAWPQSPPLLPCGQDQEGVWAPPSPRGEVWPAAVMHLLGVPQIAAVTFYFPSLRSIVKLVINLNSKLKERSGSLDNSGWELLNYRDDSFNDSLIAQVCQCRLNYVLLVCERNRWSYKFFWQCLFCQPKPSWREPVRAGLTILLNF